ncbi:MAG: PaaI family thioesterase [Candidatus Omnitrophica bacterium]|nr:PaaI family thioesterase [Candidatus Omnitrophota bacterium]
MKAIELRDDGFCFVCGKKNDKGLKLKFDLVQGARICCEFPTQKYYQGFSGIIHGGIIGMVLDEAMVSLLWKLDKQAVSAELNLRLKKPVYVGERLFIEAWIAREEKKIVYTLADCKNEKQELVASASAKCMRV